MSDGDETCGVTNDVDTTHPYACGQPAVARIAGGCAHEHVSEVLVCANCAAQHRRSFSRGKLFCHACCQVDETLRVPVTLVLDEPLV